jgi:hypothetical protein
MAKKITPCKEAKQKKQANNKTKQNKKGDYHASFNT